MKKTILVAHEIAVNKKRPEFCFPKCPKMSIDWYRCNLFDVRLEGDGKNVDRCKQCLKAKEVGK